MVGYSKLIFVFLQKEEQTNILFRRMRQIKHGILGIVAKLTLVENIFDPSRPYRMAVPRSFMKLGGFLCDDKSKCSSKRIDMKSGVQKNEGKTGGSFHSLYEFVKVAMPVIVILENLKEIFEMDASAVLSDGDFVCECMRTIGYAVCMHVISKAELLGSPKCRTRVYFIFIRLPLTIAWGAAEVLGIEKAMHDMFKSFVALPPRPQDFLLDNPVQDATNDEKEDLASPTAKKKQKTGKENMQLVSYKGPAAHADRPFVWKVR